LLNLTFNLIALLDELKNKTYVETLKLPEKSKVNQTPPLNPNKNSSKNLTIHRFSSKDTSTASAYMNDANRYSCSQTSSPIMIYATNKKCNGDYYSTNISADGEIPKTKSIKKNSTFQQKEEELILENADKKVCCKMNSCLIF
jgi:hypothetical protein